jgi:hypothetical protein
VDDSSPKPHEHSGHFADTVGGDFEPEELCDETLHDVRNISAPVRDADGSVSFALTLYGLPPRCDVPRIERARERLMRAVDALGT